MRAITFVFDENGKFQRSVQTATLPPASLLDVSRVAVAQAHALLGQGKCDCPDCAQAKPMAKSFYELHCFFGEANARQTHAEGAANGQ